MFLLEVYTVFHTLGNEWYSNGIQIAVSDSQSLCNTSDKQCGDELVSGLSVWYKWCNWKWLVIVVIYNNDFNSHIPQSLGNEALAAYLNASHAQPTQTTWSHISSTPKQPLTPTPPQKKIHKMDDILKCT
jgi:hypothetical protein